MATCSRVHSPAVTGPLNSLSNGEGYLRRHPSSLWKFRGLRGEVLQLIRAECGRNWTRDLHGRRGSHTGAKRFSETGSQLAPISGTFAHRLSRFTKVRWRDPAGSLILEQLVWVPSWRERGFCTTFPGVKPIDNVLKSSVRPHPQLTRFYIFTVL